MDFCISAQVGDHVLVRPQKQKLNAQDKFLRKFMYREALSSALETTDPTVITLSFQLNLNVLSTGYLKLLCREIYPAAIWQYIVAFLNTILYSKLVVPATLQVK